ncbi:MAG TPA: HAMP domain-containing sensor histidine kinase [Methylomirabilota bacterium]|nr:HAMP domain-containing sensor histidine kinase [Methylomirabilota bacterium]
MSTSVRRVLKTVSVRLTAWYAILFMASALVLFGLAYLLLAASLERRDRESIRLQLDDLAGHYHDGGLLGLKHVLALRERSAGGRAFLIRLAAPDGRIMLLSIPDQWADFNLVPLQRPTEDGQWVAIRARDDEDMLEVTSRRLPDGPVLQVGRSTEDREAVLQRFRQVALTIAVPVLVLALAGGMFLASRALRPVRQIIQTVRAIQAGALDARAPTRQTGDELDELSTLFNGMIERISTLIAVMREALDNVAHDLRTPMARIRGAAELALQTGAGLDACRDALADCVEETDRLLVMLNTLMDVSEAETGALRLRREAVEVRALLDDVADLYRFVAEEQGIVLLVTMPADLRATVDRTRMRQVLANLVDNAIKHTPAGGRVELRGVREQRTLVISVKDTGVGMPPDEVPRIWDRLYRGDHSRSQRGLGLGLSLVRAVVRAHGGQVVATSALGVGSTFTVSLPEAVTDPA